MGDFPESAASTCRVKVLIDEVKELSNELNHARQMECMPLSGGHQVGGLWTQLRERQTELESKRKACERLAAMHESSSQKERSAYLSWEYAERRLATAEEAQSRESEHREVHVTEMKQRWERELSDLQSALESEAKKTGSTLQHSFSTIFASARGEGASGDNSSVDALATIPKARRSVREVPVMPQVPAGPIEEPVVVK